MSRTHATNALRLSPALAGVSAVVSWSGGLASMPAASRYLQRVNFRGRTVSLRGGVGVAAGAISTALTAGQVLPRIPGVRTWRNPAAALTATAAAGAAGLIDDLDAGRHDGDTPAKGLRGHLGALAQGRVTTGALKIAVIGSGALVAGVLLARDRRPAGAGLAATALDAVTSATTIASWANVHNLMDLRPGRALKLATLISAPLALGSRGQATRALAAGALGTAAAALPEDLTEQTMLGDTGANALGALVGTALAASPSGRLRACAAAAGTALVLASEKISFSRVIARTPALAALDALGRAQD